MSDEAVRVDLTQAQIDALCWGVGPGWTEQFINPATREAAIVDLFRSLDPWTHRDGLVEAGAVAVLGRAQDFVDLQHTRLRIDANAAYFMAEIVVDAIVGAVGSGARDGDPPRRAEALSPSPASAGPPAASGGARSLAEHDPSQPPGVLLERWAESMALTSEQAAARLGFDVDTYRGICTGTELITPERAQRLAEGSTHTPNIWLMLERQFRAKLVEQSRTPNLDDP